MGPAALLALSASASVPCAQAELPNGLTTVLCPDHRAPLVHVRVAYAVGSRDEGPGEAGLAHLVEHLLFNGSASQPAEYHAPLQDVGAIVNGWTSVDLTSTWQTLGAQHLPLALFLESDRMGWLILDERRLEEQRQVVRRELEQRVEDDPHPWADEVVPLAFGPDHPYGHLTAGRHDDLERVDLAAVRRFHEAWYGPDNATLFVLGDFDPEVASELISEYFGPIPARPPPPRARRPLPTPDAPVRVDRVGTGKRGRVLIAWPSPALFAPGDAELDLLAEVLESGGRLARHLDDEADLFFAHRVDVRQRSHQLHGAFVIDVDVPEGRLPEDVVRGIDAALEAALSRPADEIRLETAALGEELHRSRRLDQLAGRGAALQTYVTFLGVLDGLERDLARYDTDWTRVVEVARETLAGPRAELLYAPAPP